MSSKTEKPQAGRGGAVDSHAEAELHRPGAEHERDGRARAALGGRDRVETAPGEGTRVALAVPLAQGGTDGSAESPVRA